jgi:glycosyltransferase involved in cell wall biosynthesis/predicted O-methyltransferase YrrM
MVTVVIPARNERFLQNTIDDLLNKASGEVEIISVLDGYWPDPPLRDDTRMRVIHFGEARGMRNAINSAVAIARGEYILKADAHTLWDEGWDAKLTADCEDNWVVVPRRKRLDAENWCVQEVNKPDIDYHYLSFPADPNDFGGAGLNGKPWDERNRNTDKFPEIDDLMSSQGSAWFMKKDYFYELELMDEASYGKFWNEFQEIGLKCWLSGGRVVVNKKTWYAHLHKGKQYGRGYHLPEEWLKQGRSYTLKWMKFGEAWHKQKYPIEWLVKKFAPVPGWDLPALESPGYPKEIQHVFDKYETVSSKPTEIINQRRDMLCELIRDLGYKVGVEIGVERGRFSQQIMEKNPDIKMFGVDHYGDYPGRFGKDQDANFAEAQERLKDYDYTFIKKTSMDALEDFEDGSLDFVYIDGDHEFSMVAQDIVQWSKKVRVGGMVAGHDYSTPRRTDRSGNVKNNLTHHVKEAVFGFMWGYRIDPWFVIGREDRKDGEVRELLRSWFYLKRW